MSEWLNYLKKIFHRRKSPELCIACRATPAEPDRYICDDCSKEHARQSINDEKNRQSQGFSNWSMAAQYDPYRDLGHLMPQYWDSKWENYQPGITMRQMGYAPSRTHTEDKRGEIVVEGEVIRDEPLRIEHDKLSI